MGLSTKEHWKDVLEKWNTAPSYDNSPEVERVVVLTPVEFSVLLQQGVGDKMDGTRESKFAQEAVESIKIVLSEKYGYRKEHDERRDVFWPLDGKIAIFVEGYLGRSATAAVEIVEN